ncbi:MAG: hypothetical protein HQ582_27905, partial [Planctomycetes bacterium]|nr:hypothetical protein [Planctomycetota bacterium]
MTEHTRHSQNGSPVTDRRAFLSRSSGLVAGAALAGCSVPKVHAGDDAIKMALIGCGGRGTGAVAQALGTKGPVKLWAMADVFEDRLELSLESLIKGQEARYDREKHGGFSNRIDVAASRRFLGFDAFKQAIDSGPDLVILSTFP